MEINKTNRSELKSYFSANEKPTGDEFAEFIDAGLNQAEDGIAKIQGSPIALQAEGDESGTQDILNLFTSFTEENPSWILSLNPRVTAQADSNQPGLNMADGAGASRLFIKAGSGEVGLGTLEPAARLTVKGPDNTAMLAVMSESSGTSSIAEITQQDMAGILVLRNGDGKPAANITAVGGQANFFLNKLGVGHQDPQVTLHVSAEAPELRISQTVKGEGPCVSLYQSDDKHWNIFLEETGSQLSFSPNGITDTNKMIRMTQIGDLQLPGAVYFKNRANGHINLDGAMYKTDGKIYLSIDDDFFVKRTHIEEPCLHINTVQGSMKLGGTNPLAPLTIAGTGKQYGPDADMHITNDCILFGGANSENVNSSGQISAGLHVSNSLNMVGIGTESANRKIDIWAEGGMTLRGHLKTNETVAFQAVVDEGDPLEGSIERVPMTAVYNHGGGYQNDCFIAPVSGIYLFCLLLRKNSPTSHDSNGQKMFWSGRLNGVNVDYFSICAMTEEQTTSGTFVIKLSANDEVSIRQGNASGIFHQYPVSGRSGFTGVLITALPDS